jgi:hypothetical protein
LPRPAMAAVEHLATCAPPPVARDRARSRRGHRVPVYRVGVQPFASRGAPAAGRRDCPTLPMASVRCRRAPQTPCFQASHWDEMGACASVSAPASR